MLIYSFACDLSPVAGARFEAARRIGPLESAHAAKRADRLRLHVARGPVRAPRVVALPPLSASTSILILEIAGSVSTTIRVVLSVADFNAVCHFRDIQSVFLFLFC